MTDENDSTTPPDRVTRSWQAARGASWPADWDGQPPPLRSGDAMTAKPWPHGWREGMRLAASKDYDPGEIITAISADGELWVCGDWTDPEEIEAWPDPGDDGTVGHLKGMVVEAIRKSPHITLFADWYALEVVDEATAGGSRPAWYEPITGKCYQTEGKAYVAALDHLARRAKLTEVEGIPLTILLQSSIPMAPSLIEPATVHGGGFVGSVADDEASVTLAAAEPAEHLADDVHLSNKSCRLHYQPSLRTGNCGCPEGRCWYTEQKDRRKQGDKAIHPDAWPEVS